jgi:hypothetical protein
MPYKTDTWSMNGVASKCVPPPAVLWRLQCSCTCQSYRARGGGTTCQRHQVALDPLIQRLLAIQTTTTIIIH